MRLLKALVEKTLKIFDIREYFGKSQNLVRKCQTTKLLALVYTYVTFVKMAPDAFYEFLDH